MGNYLGFDYSKFSSFKALEQNITQIINLDIVIGWSLGGQIAARLIEKKLLNCRLLLLIATPYQFVEDNNKISVRFFNNFYKNYQQQIGKTLANFKKMVVQNDKNHELVNDSLQFCNNEQKFWLSWLKELGSFSADNINFLGFPKTVIIHGKNDVVVKKEQSRQLQQKINNSHLYLIDDAGHAPHFSNKELITKIIAKEYNNKIKQE